jgi:hypothetical protein
LSFAFVQLLKVALRVAYVQQIKAIYYRLKEYLLSIDDINILTKINVVDLIKDKYPPLPDYLK